MRINHLRLTILLPPWQPHPQYRKQLVHFAFPQGHGCPEFRYASTQNPLSAEGSLRPIEGEIISQQVLQLSFRSSLTSIVGSFSSISSNIVLAVVKASTAASSSQGIRLFAFTPIKYLSKRRWFKWNNSAGTKKASYHKSGFSSSMSSTYSRVSCMLWKQFKSIISLIPNSKRSSHIKESRLRRTATLHEQLDKAHSIIGTG